MMKSLKMKKLMIVMKKNGQMKKIGQMKTKILMNLLQTQMEMVSYPMKKLENIMKQMVGDKDIMEKHIGFTHGLIGQKKKDGLITDKQLTTG